VESAACILVHKRHGRNHACAVRRLTVDHNVSTQTLCPHSHAEQPKTTFSAGRCRCESRAIIDYRQPNFSVTAGQLNRDFTGFRVLKHISQRFPTEL
jgi:hypothetical protein